MTERLNNLVALVKPCGIFADVGCDHGYVSEAVLEKNLAERVIATDISAPSLEKCKKRLSGFEGRYSAFVTDGLKGVTEKPEQVLIAGMGGKEIISILEDYAFADRVILQPMKDAQEVRKFLLGNGYKIERDFTFFSLGKKYDVVVAVKDYKENRYLAGTEKTFAKEDYSEDEKFFGKENVPARGEFRDYLEKTLDGFKKAFATVKDEGQKEKLGDLIKKIERVIK